MKVKLIDLYGIKYAEMDAHINNQITDLEAEGNEVLELKIVGDRLDKACVFVVYR